MVTVVLVGACAGLASASRAAVALVTQPSQTNAGISLSIATPTLLLGPFTTTHSALATSDSDGVLDIAETELSFAPVDTTLRALPFSIVLLPASNVAMSIDPKQGTAAIRGAFTMQFTTSRPGVVCEAGPFSVDATTGPPGASPYSPSTGQGTVIDAAPSIPAVDRCGGTGPAINAALSLPIAPAGASATAGAPTQTMPVPRVELHVTLSPALRPPATPTSTTTTTTAHTTGPEPTAFAVGPNLSSTSAKGAAWAAGDTSAHARHAVTSHARHRSEQKKRPKKTPTTANAAASLNGTSDLSLSPMTPLATPPAHTHDNSLPAFVPASSAQPDTGSQPGLVVILVLGTIGLAVALWLIRSDLRGLFPARSGPIYAGLTRPSRTSIARPDGRMRR